MPKSLRFALFVSAWAPLCACQLLSGGGSDSGAEASDAPSAATPPANEVGASTDHGAAGAKGDSTMAAEHDPPGVAPPRNANGQGAPAPEQRSKSKTGEAAPRTLSMASAPTQDEVDLKLARIWARVDQLENELNIHRQRVAILEKGLLLGVIPDELQKSPAHPDKPTLGAPAAGHEKEGQAHATHPGHPAPGAGTAAAGHGPSVGAPSRDSSTLTDASDTANATTRELGLRLAQGRAHYRAGRYGKAIAEFSAIAQDFDDNVSQGEQIYWTGLSWIQLRENTGAEQALNEYITKFPNQKFIPRAKLELARLHGRMGMRERALGDYKNIIENHSKDPAAEQARAEIAKMQVTL